MANEKIDVKGLNVSFGKKNAVKNIDITFNSGETVLIAGRNGAGKSTFLRALGGLIVPDSGKVNYGEINKDKIGIITDKMSLFESYSLKEAVNFHSEIFGINKLNSNILDQINIDMDRKVSELSSGERALFQLSLLISQKPKLLLIDEVIYMMDSYIRDFFLEAVIELIDEVGTTIIMVNHTFSDTGKIPERIIIMENGKILIDESRDKLLQNVKKVITGKEELTDLPSIFSRETPLGNEYFLYPFKKGKTLNKDFIVEDIGLTEIIKAFLGGSYVKERD
ncbi:MAG: ATP-binding cassette domain-containing protein [Acidobacteriota bacterium]